MPPTCINIAGGNLLEGYSPSLMTTDYATAADGGAVGGAEHIVNRR